MNAHRAGTPTRVEVNLPRPVTLGAVRLWNYAKTSSRGVRSFSIEFDGD